MTTRRSLRRAQRPRALSDKGLSLYNLDRKDEALNLYDKIARRKAKGPAQRGVAAKALFNKGYLLYELDRKDGALRVCDEMVARFGTAKEPRLREVVALALSCKEFLLYILNRKGGALRVCDEIVARFGTANEPKLRGLVAGALSGKRFLLCELDRKDEALAVCYEFLRYRFGEDNEPELRGMMEGILSAKKTSLASSRACPPAWDLPNGLRNIARPGPRPEIFLREKGPRFLLAAPSTLPETASASSRAVGPSAAAHPESPQRSPATEGSAAGRDPRRTH